MLKQKQITNKDLLTMTQKFGDFIDEMPDRQEYLIIAFSPSSISLQERWRNNGLSADFMADYFITFFYKPVAKMGTQKSGSAGNQYCFFTHYFVVFIPMQ